MVSRNIKTRALLKMIGYIMTKIEKSQLLAVSSLFTILLMVSNEAKKFVDSEIKWLTGILTDAY